jgi:hypothetical protein
MKKTMVFGILIASVALGRGLFGQDSDEPLERTWRHGPLELRLDLSNRAPLVSDELSVRIRASVPAGAEVQLPSLEGMPKEFQLNDKLKSGPIVEPSGREAWDLVFRLEVLRPGEIEFPALPVRYRLSPDADWVDARTESIPIEFRSLLGPDPDSAEPKPNPQPIVWPEGWFAWAIGLLAAMAIALLGMAIWMRRKRRPRVMRPEIQISAYQKAMQGMRRIEAAGYLERGDVERFYTALSGVVRHYVEDRFGMRAPEQTTEEFLMELTNRPVLSHSQRDAMGAFLERCDLVKFAKVRPTSHEGATALTAARTFVEATRDDSMLVAVASAAMETA